MTRVLVTGATGFVGRALVPHLGAAGHDVIALARGQGDFGFPETVEVRTIPDIGPDTDWTEALAGVEAVVHSAARVHVMRDRAGDPLARFRTVNRDGAERLARAAADHGVRRLVFLSSVKAMGEASPDAPFTEETAPAPVDPYGVSKREAEQALRQAAAETGLETVILRPPFVYGPGCKGNALTLLKVVQAAPPLPFAALANRRSMIYVGNLVHAIGACLDHARAAGETYVLRDGPDLTVAEFFRAAAAALERPARLFPVPRAWLRLAGAVTGQSDAMGRLLDTLVVEDQKIRRDLGWTPPFTPAQGLRETAAWFNARQGG